MQRYLNIPLIPLKLWLTFGFSLILFISGIIIDTHTSRIPVLQQQQFLASIFHSQPLHTLHTEPPEEQKMAVQVPLFIFKSPAPQYVRNVKIAFRYRCEPACQQLWLTLINQPPQVSPRILITHQLFHELPWFHMLDTNVALFQKQITYPTIQAFYENPPTEGLIIDEQISQIYQPDIPEIQFIEQVENVDDAQYILTTYLPSRQIDTWTFFSKILNVQHAQHDDQHNLSWQIETVSDHPDQKVWITQPYFEYH